MLTFTPTYCVQESRLERTHQQQSTSMTYLQLEEDLAGCVSPEEEHADLASISTIQLTVDFNFLC
jgi:hypothetical protein